MKSFLNKIEIRKHETDGIEEWTWIKSDTGGFGTDTNGPRNDWLTSHKEKYFKYIKKYDTIVTAGACCGMYTRFYAERFKTVYAFEPDVRNFHCLVMNNPFDNVIKINAALGSEHAMIKMTKHQTNVGALSVETDGIIPMLKLDDFAFKSCDVIQLDVERFEEYVILGAEETIKKFKPVIIVENLDNIVLMNRLGYYLADKSKMDRIYLPKE